MQLVESVCCRAGRTGPDRRRLSIKVLARNERAGDEEGSEVAAGGPSAPYTRRVGGRVFNDVFQFVTSECYILPDVTIYSSFRESM